MDLMSLDELKALTTRYPGLCLSIFMPTHRAGRDTQQDPIRFRNLLREAEGRLSAFDLRSPEVRGLLEPARQRLDDPAFWRHQSDGLAVFLSPETSRFYRLPLKLEELIVVADRFHVKPLLPLFTGNGHFFILALSQKQIAMLEGTRHSVDEVELEGVPASLAEALGTDSFERQLQARTTGPGGAAVFHGHGALADEAKDRILRYFRLVDRGLRETLREERAPLVLAGVEYLFPLYREANTYPYLADAGLPGNPEALRPEDLHAAAWAVVEPWFLQAQQAAGARYRQLAGTGRTSTVLDEVVRAAYHGRVDVLFVAAGAQAWGRFIPDTGSVDLHAEPEPGDEDLLDLAALQTILNSGTVYAVDPRRVPDAATLAAIFRF